LTGGVFPFLVSFFTEIINRTSVETTVFFPCKTRKAGETLKKPFRNVVISDFMYFRTFSNKKIFLFAFLTLLATLYVCENYLTLENMSTLIVIGLHSYIVG